SSGSRPKLPRSKTRFMTFLLPALGIVRPPAIVPRHHASLATDSHDGFRKIADRKFTTVDLNGERPRPARISARRLAHPRDSRSTPSRPASIFAGLLPVFKLVKRLADREDPLGGAMVRVAFFFLAAACARSRSPRQKD